MPILGLDDFIREYGQAVLEQAAVSVFDDMLATVPVATGELRDSGSLRLDRLRAYVRFTAPQADYTDLGTNPHRISAVFAPQLTFFWEKGPDGPGIYHFDHVNHPGQEGQRWFSDRIDDWSTYVQDAIGDLP